MAAQSVNCAGPGHRGVALGVHLIWMRAGDSADPNSADDSDHCESLLAIEHRDPVTFQRRPNTGRDGDPTSRPSTVPAAIARA